MQLTLFTDLSLRVLMYLTQVQTHQSATVAQIAQQFGVSREHLVKVVHALSKKGYILTSKGRSGGIALALPLNAYRLGDMVRDFEGQNALIDCAKTACPLTGMCQLKGVLEGALTDFYAQLNHYSLADACASPTNAAIIKMMGQAQ